MVRSQLPPTQRELNIMFEQKQIILPATLQDFDEDPHDPVRRDEVFILEQTKEHLKQLIKERMCALSDEELEKMDTPFFSFTNAAGQTQQLSLRCALRLASTKTAVDDLVDFLGAPGDQGFGLSGAPEYIEGRAVKKIMLTIRQGKTWLRPGDVREPTAGQREMSATLVQNLKLWEYDYVAVPIIKPYTEPEHQGLEENNTKKHSQYDHTYTVIFCGFSDRVQQRMAWLDPIWSKPTVVNGEKTYVNMERCISFRQDSYHHLQTVRKRACASLAQHLPNHPYIDDFVPSFFRIDSYEDFSHGVAMCMALAKIWQTPLAYLNGTSPALAEGETHLLGPQKINRSVGDIWHALWDEKDKMFHRTGHATTVAFQKVCQAYERERDGHDPLCSPSRANVFEELGGVEVNASEVDSYLWTVFVKGSWRKYKYVERLGHLPSLYYLVYQEKHKENFDL